MRKTLAAAVLLALAAPAAADPPARIVLVNANAPGVGLNDPTPASELPPAPGNPGTTLGEQRWYALQHAANIWASQLRSKPAIRIRVSFAQRTCFATSAVLASAGAMWVDLNFKHATVADTWYHGALANKLAKGDIAPESDEIQAIFNINLGSSTGGSDPTLPGGGPCFQGSPFYLGLDGNEGTATDLVATALHEFAHGLGFSQFANVSTGALFAGAPDIYNRHLLDTTSGLTWDMMTNAQRVASAINNWNVVWVGEQVAAAVPSRLAFGVPGVRITSPASLEGFYQLGTAAFGPPVSSPGVSGRIVVARDAAVTGTPASPTDGCSPIENVSEVSGNIGLVDRGTCGFAVKARNLQAAGAIGAIIANNAAGPPPGMAFDNAGAVSIVTVSIAIENGNKIKAATEPVFGNIGLDLTRRAGANDDGLALMNAPNPVQPGSTISHFDPVASPNLLMEPAINKDLNHTTDLTYPLLLDIGWLDEEDRP